MRLLFEEVKNKTAPASASKNLQKVFSIAQSRFAPYNGKDLHFDIEQLPSGSFRSEVADPLELYKDEFLNHVDQLDPHLKGTWISHVRNGEPLFAQDDSPNAKERKKNKLSHIKWLLSKEMRTTILLDSNALLKEKTSPESAAVSLATHLFKTSAPFDPSVIEEWAQVTQIDPIDLAKALYTYTSHQLSTEIRAQKVWHSSRYLYGNYAPNELDALSLSYAELMSKKKFYLGIQKKLSDWGMIEPHLKFSMLRNSFLNLFGHDDDF